uniref:Sprouty RTK signaling antagonist 2 n=1 Tax=Paramormyrops kingsleyae TaxID=1676925 RepID=A0A3B3S930_9TELE
MLTRTQDGDGSPGLLHAQCDGGRQWAEELDPAEASSWQLQVPCLDQIGVSRGRNMYTEGPGHKTLEISQQNSELEICQMDDQEQYCNTHQLAHTPQVNPTQPALVTSTRFWTSAGNDRYSTSLEQSLLETSSTVQIVVGHAELEELKPEAPKTAATKVPRAHSSRCSDCGKCKCDECTRRQMLPSCWVCSRRCIFSMENLVEYGTCLCCIKGLFYHCSPDDEDECADDPCSCSQSRCCVRWCIMGMVSLFLPCLFCYFPLKGCLKVFQACYDCARRPGCRCKNSNVEKNQLLN